MAMALELASHAPTKRRETATHDEARPNMRLLLTRKGSLTTALALRLALWVGIVGAQQKRETLGSHRLRCVRMSPLGRTFWLTVDVCCLGKTWSDLPMSDLPMNVSG
jgi:hypothetical protein